MDRIDELFDTRRWVFYVDETAYTEGRGYTPSVVFENEPGHYPLTGDHGRHGSPWYWGPTLEAAQRTAEELNLKRGLSRKDIVQIVASSMRASHLPRSTPRRRTHHS